MQVMQVWAPGQEDPVEKEIATHSSILDWEIPWMEEPEWLQSMGHQESDTTEWVHFHFSPNFTEWSAHTHFLRFLRLSLNLSKMHFLGFHFPECISSPLPPILSTYPHPTLPPPC